MNPTTPAGSARPGYTYRARIPFQDVDAAGVVFFARIFVYFHDAYVAFLREAGAPLEDAIRDRSWVAPLRHAEADYRRPLRFGQAITVAVDLVRRDETEFELAYRIETDEGLACTGRTVHVSVEPETFRRAPIPPILRTALDRLNRP